MVNSVMSRIRGCKLGVMCRKYES